MFNENEIKGESVTIRVPSVESWTLKELKYCCKNNKVKGYTKMNKEQLVVAVKKILENL